MRRDRLSPELEELVRQAHADDVSRARAIIDRALAAAEAEWIPLNAVQDALIGAARSLAAPRATPPLNS